MKKKYDVVVVGELNVDLIFNRIRDFPKIGKEILADDMTYTLGSSSAIFASNLSVLGTDVAFVGKLGVDSFGDHIVSILQSKGIHIGHIKRTPDEDTGVTLVLNREENRAMITYPGAMRNLSAEDVPDEILLDARHLHVSSVFLQEGLRHGLGELYSRARALGLTTSMDPQWDPNEQWDIDLNALLPLVDVFVPNKVEIQELTDSTSVPDAVHSLKEVCNVLVVKDGQNGAYLWTGSELIHEPALRNNHIVDCIGAGDSFNAGFIHKYVKGKPLRECLEFGILTGAINTTRPGGIGAFENFNLVKSIAGSSFNCVLE